MSIETAVLAAVVFGGAAVVMIISFALAKLEDKTRRMAHDHQHPHYGNSTD